MGISVIAATIAKNADGTPTPSLSLAKPTGTQSGDGILIFGYKNLTTSATITPPSGFVSYIGGGPYFTDTGGTPNFVAFSYYKQAGGSEPSSYSWSQTGTTSSAVWGLCAITIRNQDTAVNCEAASVSSFGSFSSGSSRAAPNMTLSYHDTVFTYRGGISTSNAVIQSYGSSDFELVDFGSHGGGPGRSCAVYVSSVFQPTGSYTGLSVSSTGSGGGTGGVEMSVAFKDIYATGSAAMSSDYALFDGMGDVPSAYAGTIPVARAAQYRASTR